MTSDKWRAVWLWLEWIGAALAALETWLLVTGRTTISVAVYEAAQRYKPVYMFGGLLMAGFIGLNMVSPKKGIRLITLCAVAVLIHIFWHLAAC